MSFDEQGREVLGMACAHCGRPDQPEDSRCKGCGARHAASDAIEVTTIADPERRYLWTFGQRT